MDENVRKTNENASVKFYARVFLFLSIQYMCLKKLEQSCSISGDLVYVSQKIEQACTNSMHLVYVSQKNRTGVFYFKFLSKV